MRDGCRSPRFDPRQPAGSAATLTAWLGGEARLNLAAPAGRGSGPGRLSGRRGDEGCGRQGGGPATPSRAAIGRGRTRPERLVRRPVDPAPAWQEGPGPRRSMPYPYEIQTRGMTTPAKQAASPAAAAGALWAAGLGVRAQRRTRTHSAGIRRRPRRPAPRPRWHPATRGGRQWRPPSSIALRCWRPIGSGRCGNARDGRGSRRSRSTRGSPPD